MSSNGTTPVVYIPPTEREELIIRAYIEDGLSVKEIAGKLALPVTTVKNTIIQARLRKRAHRVQEEIKEVIFKDKVPILEAIGDRGLIALFEWLEAFTRKGVHKGMSVEDAGRLTAIIEKLHTMFRLNLGKSTANLAVAIEHTTKTMTEILNDLKKPASEGGDPFVQYEEP